MLTAVLLEDVTQTIEGGQVGLEFGRALATSRLGCRQALAWVRFYRKVGVCPNGWGGLQENLRRFLKPRWFEALRTWVRGCGAQATAEKPEHEGGANGVGGDVEEVGVTVGDERLVEFV